MWRQSSKLFLSRIEYVEAIRPKVPSNGVFEGSLVRGLSLTEYVEAIQKEVSLSNGVC